MDLEQLRSDPRLSDPFLTPDWRYQRVLKMISHEPAPLRPTRRDDSYITALRAFLLRWKRGEAERDKLLVEDTALYHAWGIFDRTVTDPQFRFMIEARLLANQTPAEIAFVCKTLPEAVVYYDSLFFNVSPFLEHHDWIVKHVLLPSAVQVNDSEEEEDFVSFATPPLLKPHLDITLKFFAYFGGPIVCEFMITNFRNGQKCLSKDDLVSWFDQTHMHAIGSRSSQAAGVFEVNKYNVMELFATHARIMEIQKSSGSDAEKQNDIEKHVKAMLTQIPWTSGKAGQTSVEGSIIAQVDSGAAEMNAEELMLASAGFDVLDFEDFDSPKIK